MSRLSAIDDLFRWIDRVDEGYILTMGLMPCQLCHNATTRVRTSVTGTTVCITCLGLIEAVRDSPTCSWKRPKGHRVVRRKSDEEHVLFVDGPANGEARRRGCKTGEGKKKTLVTWMPTPLVKMDGCWYMFDPLDDAYHHVS